MITVGLLFHQLLLSAICVVGVCSLHHMSAAYVSSLLAYHAMIGRTQPASNFESGETNSVYRDKYWIQAVPNTFQAHDAEAM